MFDGKSSEGLTILAGIFVCVMILLGRDMLTTSAVKLNDKIMNHNIEVAQVDAIVIGKNHSPEKKKNKR